MEHPTLLRVRWHPVAPVADGFRLPPSTGFGWRYWREGPGIGPDLDGGATVAGSPVGASPREIVSPGCFRGVTPVRDGAHGLVLTRGTMLVSRKVAQRRRTRSQMDHHPGSTSPRARLNLLDVVAA